MEVGRYCQLGVSGELSGVVSNLRRIGCADKNNPGVYTEVPAFLEWIHEHTGLGKVTETSLTTEATTETSTSIKPLTIVCSPSHLADGVVIYSTSSSCSVLLVLAGSFMQICANSSDIVPIDAHEMMAHVIEEYTGYEKDGGLD